MPRVSPAVILLCFLFACGGGHDTVASPTARLDGEWLLTSGHGPDGEVSVPRRAEVTLEVTGGSMTGTAACNAYEGRLVVEGSSIEASRIAQTDMGCDAARSRAEDRYLTALQAIETYRRSSDRLTLLGENTELIFEKVPTPPTASFSETDWKLNALLHGSGGGGSASEPRPARITFAEDGTFEGTTGCRTISGRWQMTGDVVTTSEIELGAGPCRGPKAEQDEHVVSVFEAGFTVAIQEQTLALSWDEGKRGLYYVVRD